MNTPKTNQQGRTFRCESCRSDFLVMRPLKLARCGSCGSLQTRELTKQEIRDAKRSVTVPNPNLPATQYACVDCTYGFTWNSKQGEPACGKCGGHNLKAVSPTARVLLVKRTPQGIREVVRESPISVKEAKRIKFVRKQWRMRCELKEWVDGLENKLLRLGFGGDRIEAAKEMMRAMLAEVDQEQQALLERFDPAYSAIQVG